MQMLIEWFSNFKYYILNYYTSYILYILFLRLFFGSRLPIFAYTVHRHSSHVPKYDSVLCAA